MRASYRPAPGIGGYEILSRDSAIGESDKFVTIMCSPGKRVLGGGAETGRTDVDPPGGFSYVTASAPLLTSEGWGWMAAAVGPDNNKWMLRVHAICADDAD